MTDLTTFEPALSHESTLTWKLIKTYLEEGSLVPVIGPGVITFGEKDSHGKEKDTPLYPWLLEQLSREYQVSPVPSSLHELVCFVKLNRPRVDEDTVRAKMTDLLEGLRGKPPGPLMRKLVSLPNCQTYFTLGCDPFLERALTDFHGSVETWNSANAKSDLPAAKKGKAVLGYLFGKVSPLPDSFHLWDADAIEFAFNLQKFRGNSSFKRLNHTLGSRNLLLIGAEMSDWALRFLLRIIQNDKLSKQTDRFLFLAEQLQGQAESATAFFDSVSKRIHFRKDDPIAFARRLCEEVSVPTTPREASTEEQLGIEPVPARGAIFISYEHAHDKEAALRLARKLHAHGCRIWMDVTGLRGGEDFAKKLKRAVQECGFFVSVVSRHTEARKDRSWFMIERNCAADCYKGMSEKTRRYYFRIIIDDTPDEPLDNEPAAFDGMHNWRAPAGDLSDKDAQDLADEQKKLFPL